MEIRRKVVLVTVGLVFGFLIGIGIGGKGKWALQDQLAQAQRASNNLKDDLIQTQKSCDAKELAIRQSYQLAKIKEAILMASIDVMSSNYGLAGQQLQQAVVASKSVSFDLSAELNDAQQKILALNPKAKESLSNLTRRISGLQAGQARVVK